MIVKPYGFYSDLNAKYKAIGNYPWGIKCCEHKCGIGCNKQKYLSLEFCLKYTFAHVFTYSSDSVQRKP